MNSAFCVMLVRIYQTAVGINRRFPPGIRSKPPDTGKYTPRLPAAFKGHLVGQLAIYPCSAFWQVLVGNGKVDSLAGCCKIGGMFGRTPRG